MQYYNRFITSWTSMFNEVTFREILLPSSRSIYRNVASLNILHMFQLFRFEREAPFWKDTSRPPGPSWNLPLWDNPGLNFRYLWIFQVDTLFYKLDVKILAAKNEIRCVSSSYPPSSSSALDPCQQRRSIVLAFAKNVSGTSLKINTICNF